MRRRDYFAAVSAATAMIVAGCNAITGGDGDDQELYEQGNEDELLPDAAGVDWPDPNLERTDEDNKFIDRIF
jgi:hypothetical protein